MQQPLPEPLSEPVDIEVSAIKVNLFNIDGPEMFIAQSGLLSRISAPNHTSNYSTDVMQYTLGQNADEIRVPLTWDEGNGIRVTKTFIFKRGEYEITDAVQYAIDRLDETFTAVPVRAPVLDMTGRKDISQLKEILSTMEVAY